MINIQSFMYFYMFKKYGHGAISLALYIVLQSPVSAQKYSYDNQFNLNNSEVMSYEDNRFKSGLEEQINNWQIVASDHSQQQQYAREIDTCLKNAQILIELGRYTEALPELKKAVRLSKENNNSLLLNEAKEKLANAYAGMGNYDEAIKYYRSVLSKRSDSKSLSTLNNLVKTLFERIEINSDKAKNMRTKEEKAKLSEAIALERQDAMSYAKRALIATRDSTSTSTVRALIQWHERVEKLNPQQLNQGASVLGLLPASRAKAYLIIEWSNVDRDNRSSWLTKARETAVTINNLATISYVDLELGHLYKREKKYDRALSSARQAQLTAQADSAYDALFRSQWLAAKIYARLGQKDAALNSYRSAIDTIDAIDRSSVSFKTKKLLDLNRDIELIYRETLTLLLDNPKASSKDLFEARRIFDRIRLVQLQQYFNDDCIEILRQELDSFTLEQKNAASIDSIILDDKTYFILQLPNGKLIKSEANVNKQVLIKKVDQWYRNLTTNYNWQFPSQSRWFYDLIIKPFEDELSKNNDLETIVFIHDGILRNLPMAAMLDEKGQFFAQKWASVSSLGLKFTVPEAERDLQALAFGLEKPITGWSKLTNVSEEIKSVIDYLGGDAFINRDFTIENFQRQIRKQDYSVLHLATHGYFGGDVESSFILGYDSKITALKLEDILLNSGTLIDLMVLSACQTAIGDEKSLLGLAGIASRSGVSSVLGSLWQVQDEDQFETIDKFYSLLSFENKATALQEIQIEQIERLTHPVNWAALVLIGSW